MQGQTETVSDTSVADGAFEYKFLTDSATPLRNPVGENIRYDCTEGYPPFGEGYSLSDWLSEHALGEACFKNTNLVPSFCDAYINDGDKKVLAVHCAKGSTTIAEWLKDTKNYDVLLKKSLAAKSFAEKKHTIGKIFFVWLQGESDAVKGNSKEYYKEKLKALNASLKNDIGIDRFCIIRVGRFVCDKRDDEIMNAQSEICHEDSDFLMLTEEASDMYETEEYMNPFASGHFSAKGLERLGTLAGTALREKEV